MKKVMMCLALVLVLVSFACAEEVVRSHAQTNFVVAAEVTDGKIVGDYSGSSFCGGWICALVGLIVLLVVVILIVRKRKRRVVRRVIKRKVVRRR